jgi:hypothetical protein
MESDKFTNKGHSVTRGNRRPERTFCFRMCLVLVRWHPVLWTHCKLRSPNAGVMQSPSQSHGPLRRKSFASATVGSQFQVRCHARTPRPPPPREAYAPLVWPPAPPSLQRELLPIAASHLDCRTQIMRRPRLHSCKYQDRAKLHEALDLRLVANQGAARVSFQQHRAQPLATGTEAPGIAIQLEECP